MYYVIIRERNYRKFLSTAYYARLLEGFADIRCIVQLLVQLLDPTDLRGQPCDWIPEEKKVDKLPADAPLALGNCILVGIEVPSVLHSEEVKGLTHTAQLDRPGLVSPSS